MSRLWVNTARKWGLRKCLALSRFHRDTWQYIDPVTRGSTFVSAAEYTVGCAMGFCRNAATNNFVIKEKTRVAQPKFEITQQRSILSSCTVLGIFTCQLDAVLLFLLSRAFKSQGTPDYYVMSSRQYGLFI